MYHILWCTRIGGIGGIRDCAAREIIYIYIRLSTPFDVWYQEYIGFADLLVAARLSESSIFNDE